MARVRKTPRVDISKRVNLRVPNETFAEISVYAERSGIGAAQFFLHGCVVGCRLLDQMTHVLQYATDSQLRASAEVMAKELGAKMGVTDEAQLAQVVQEVVLETIAERR
jgi:hypothetical protein